MDKRQIPKTAWWLVMIALIAGLILTIISVANLCTAECSENHNWRLFGLPFEPFGFAFFIAAITLHLLSRKYPHLWKWTAITLFSGVGAEITFIWVQHAKIGTWCPVCLSIAGTIFFAATVFAIVLATKHQSNNQGNPMKLFKTELGGGIALTLTLLATFFGVSKVDAMQDLSDNLKQEIAFGKKDSNIEGYLFTDWACPACRKIEPNIDSIMTSVTSKGKFYFVDHVIHPETLNYIPFNLSFMINNKPEYVKLRHMLTKLSTQTTSPTEDQISALADAIGTNFKEIDYANVAAGISYFKKLGTKFNIKGTPTLVLINRETKKGKRLTGSDDITPDKIDKAIIELQG